MKTKWFMITGPVLLALIAMVTSIVKTCSGVQGFKSGKITNSKVTIEQYCKDHGKGAQIPKEVITGDIDSSEVRVCQ